MNTIIGIFKDRVAAESAINELKAAGIHDTDVSFVSSKWESETAEPVSHVGAGAASGATTGALLGTIAGLVVANGILPGLGTLFVAGPIATALGLTGAVATTAAGALTGAAAGGLVGALTSLGVSDEDARMYEERVRSGDILVTARTTDLNVAHIYEKYGAEEIRTY